MASGAGAIGNFLLSIVLGAVLAFLTRSIVRPIMELSVPGGSVETTSASWFTAVLDNFPLLVLVWTIASLIFIAARDREVGV